MSARSTRLPTRRRLRIGVVGLGYWGPNLLRVLADMDGVSVDRICDLQPERLERYSRRYPAVRTTRDIDELLEDPHLDALVLATPVDTHFTLASRSIQAGKHTFVEKPLAASAERADELIRLAEQNDLALMCGYTFLYSPAVRAVKQLLDRGDLGDIYFISSSRVNLGLHQRDVGVIWDLGPHDFSILLYWLESMPEYVATIGRDAIVAGIPDVAFLTLMFPGGIIAHVELSWLSPTKLRRTAIAGSSKMVVYDDVSTEPVKIFDHGVVYQDPDSFGEYQLSYRTGDIVTPRLDTVEPLAVELQDFASAVRTGETPAGHLELGRNVVELAEAAEASLRSGGAPVPVASARTTG